MKTHWKHVSTIALISAFLATGPVMADDQLRAQVNSQLAEHNIKVMNPDALSDNQIAQIEVILNTVQSDPEKMAMVESLLADREPCVGNEQLRAQIAGQLAEHNIDIANYDQINGSELALIQTVLSGNSPETTKQTQIKMMFAPDSPMVGTEALRRNAAQCIQKVNAKVDNLEALTPDELVQIQLISNSTDNTDTKRSMIEKLANE